VSFYEKVGQKSDSTCYKSRAKVGILLLKVGIVGLFSYVYIDKSGKKFQGWGAAMAKMGILARFMYF